MNFVALLNDNIPVLSILIGSVLFIGIRIGYRQGGWNRNLIYIWTLIIYMIYVLITPLYYYSVDRKTIVGTDISGYYGLGFFFNLLAVISFIVGYNIKGRVKNDVWKAPPRTVLTKPVKRITIMFCAFYVIVLFNLALGGANIQEVFIGDEIIGMGAGGGSYFLQNFTDSLVCVIVIAYLYEVPWKYLAVWIVAAFFLFSLLGFRYRIVLSLFGILFVYLYKHKVTPGRIFIGFLLAVVFFYGIMFSTENRRRLIVKEYDELVFDPFKFEYERFFEQTRGALPDMAIYKLYDNPNRNPSYDYGVTMFGYVFIRMIPRSIYPDKDKFYPPPQLATTIEAYDAYWARYSGEATLSVGALYIAFGWLGIVVGHFIWGALIRRYSDSIRKDSLLQLATLIVIALVSFQWITRGYLPQIIDQLGYMLIPIWILRYFSKKIPDADN